MVVMGFSNGGMMAGALACARPDLVGGVALLCSAYPLPPHIYAMGGIAGMPMVAVSGGADPFHPPDVHAAGVAAYRAAGAHVSETIDTTGTHSVTPEHVRILRKWLAGWESDVFRG
jgi:phospholipase/carboxylesterase